MLLQVVVLYVDEETSIKRQLQRARVANLHNRRVLDAGAGKCRHEGSYRVSAGLANDLSMLYVSFSHVLTA